MIYGYVRLTKERQLVAKQKESILSFADKHGLIVEKWIRADGSEAGKKIEKLKKEDGLIVSKLFRLGQDIASILNTLKTMLESDVCVCSAEDDLTLKNDMALPSMAYCFGLAASVAKENRVRLSKESLEIARKAGKKLGRPRGRVSRQTLLSGKEEEIQHLLEENASLNHISEIMKVDRGTVRRFLKNHPGLAAESAHA